MRDFTFCPSSSSTKSPVRLTNRIFLFLLLVGPQVPSVYTLQADKPHHTSKKELLESTPAVDGQGKKESDSCKRLTLDGFASMKNEVLGNEVDLLIPGEPSTTIHTSLKTADDILAKIVQYEYKYRRTAQKASKFFDQLEVDLDSAWNDLTAFLATGKEGKLKHQVIIFMHKNKRILDGTGKFQKMLDELGELLEGRNVLVEDIAKAKRVLEQLHHVPCLPQDFFILDMHVEARVNDSPEVVASHISTMDLSMKSIDNDIESLMDIFHRSKNVYQTIVDVIYGNVDDARNFIEALRVNRRVQTSVTAEVVKKNVDVLVDNQTITPSTD